MGRLSTATKASPRDAASKVAQQRLSVLELARELGNVAEACRQRGMDRTSFYEWKRRFQTQSQAKPNAPGTMKAACQPVNGDHPAA